MALPPSTPCILKLGTPTRVRACIQGCERAASMGLVFGFASASGRCQFFGLSWSLVLVPPAGYRASASTSQLGLARSCSQRCLGPPSQRKTRLSFVQKIQRCPRHRTCRKAGVKNAQPVSQRLPYCPQSPRDFPVRGPQVRPRNDQVSGATCSPDGVRTTDGARPNFGLMAR
jgi:hypothetical protein